VGGGYRLSNVWLAKEVNKEVKKKLQHVRRNFKNVTIELAIQSHSAPILRLRRISIARKKSYISV
jgi:hypothetical protein